MKNFGLIATFLFLTLAIPSKSAAQCNCSQLRFVRSYCIELTCNATYYHYVCADPSISCTSCLNDSYAGICCYAEQVYSAAGGASCGIYDVKLMGTPKSILASYVLSCDGNFIPILIGVGKR